MSLKSTISPDDDRIRLAHALGFDDYPRITTPDPYLDYILQQHADEETLVDYIELFIKVIMYFGSGTAAPTIRTIVNELSLSGFRDVFADTVAGNLKRKKHVEDTVMCILGTWVTMLSSFQERNSSRKITAAFTIFADPTTLPAPTQPSLPTATTTSTPNVTPYKNSVAGLISGSGLLPGGMWDHRMACGGDATMKLMSLLLDSQNNSNHTALQTLLGQVSSSTASSYTVFDDLDIQESLSIKATRLNAFTLNVLSTVDIRWTQNISRHMLLSKYCGRHVLELFSLPCAFGAITAPPIAIPVELTHEIEESYAIFFNAWYETPAHVKLGRFVGIRKYCWCWSCSAYRFRRKCVSACKRHDKMNSRQKGDSVSGHFDPFLETLMTNQSIQEWTPGAFPNFWSRIVRLEQHLQTSRPWSLSVLFRDRRDTMQFWTFLFATMVVFLTIVQVLLGIAQVAGSFK